MMKARLLQFFLAAIFFSMVMCKAKQDNFDPEQIIKDYYSGLNTGNFDLISECTSENIHFAEMDYELSNNKTELYRLFQWDSVFSPKCELLKLEKDSNAYIATISKTCKRIHFLQDTAIVCKTKFIFDDGLISDMQITEYIYQDLDKWLPRRDSLVVWIDQNHPELSGFLSDLSIQGAQNYLKAIELSVNEQ